MAHLPINGCPDPPAGKGPDLPPQNPSPVDPPHEAESAAAPTGRPAQRFRARLDPLVVARRTRRTWRRIAPFFGGMRSNMVALFGASFAAGLAEASLLALIATGASAVSLEKSRAGLDLGPMQVSGDVSTVLWIGVVLAVLRGVLMIYLAWLPAQMSATVMAGLRRKLFDAFTGACWSVQASERDGHLQSLMGTHINSASQAVLALAMGINALVMFATLLASAFVLSIPTALILIVSSGGLFLILRPLSKRLRRHAKELSNENLEYSKSVQEVVLMAEEIKVFGASDDYRTKFYRAVEGVREPQRRTRFLSTMLPYLYQSIALLLLVLALLAVSNMGVTRIASLGAVILILLRSLTYAQQMQRSMSNLDEMLPFMDRLADSIDHYLSNRQTDGERPLGHIRRLGMDHVRFAYVEGKDVLHDITFESHLGEAIGIVGPSGAGKSSIVQLLLRLREPSGGALLVDGEDARSIVRRDWQQRIAYVPQTSQIVYGTVEENIRFFRPHLTQEDIVSAATRAAIHDEILSWRDGYDTVIGQRVSAVSGGQRQRLCLARALAARPDVLILDEPTSALDVKSELLVQETLERLKREVILFLVAHRLSTLAVCDRVMVVVDGRLEAIDEPTRLLESNDFYREVLEITRKQTPV